MTQQGIGQKSDEPDDGTSHPPGGGDAPAGEASAEGAAPSAPASPPPPRGPDRITVLAALVLVAVSLAVGIMWGQPIKQAAGGLLAMLPIGHDHSEHAESAEGGAYYTCGMHPWVILPRPGSCPICHMDLVPLDPAKFTGAVVIDPIMVQNIGVRIDAVASGPLTRRIRTVGTVDYDETGVRDVNIKVPGWIEKLHIDYLGAAVEAGQPLFDFYSPDLYAAQEEYLLARESLGKIGADFVPDAARGARDLLESARTRLLYFDVAQQQIDDLERRGKPAKTLPILSPHSGVVIDKHANEGMKVDQGMRVYRIADLTRVWVMVTLYEYQLPFVQVGQSAVMTLPYVPGQTFAGKVIYVYPYLDKRTREVQVRLEFDNPGLLLKPGMFASVELRSTLAEQRTLVAREAILDTGERQMAFVSLGGGKFEPRQVAVGVESGDGMVEILDGLKPGEMVVVSGQFLLDSEANIRESLAKMIRGQPAAEQAGVAAVAGRSELEALPQAMAAELGRVLESYFALGKQLAGDSTAEMAEPAGTIAQAVDTLLQTPIPDHPHFWHEHEEAATVRGKSLELAGIADLDDARLLFADLSVALAKLVRATGVPPAFGREVQQLRCPMYRSGQGGTIWLQPAGDVRNPYYGSSMRECFDERMALPVTGDKSAAPQPNATEE